MMKHLRQKSCMYSNIQPGIGMLGFAIEALQEPVPGVDGPCSIGT